MTYALPNIPDPLIRSTCSYLDIHSLCCLAGTSKKFHELAVQSTPAKVQLIVQKQWQDLGLRRESHYDPRELKVGVVVNGTGFLAFENDKGVWSNEVLLADRGRFSPSSQKIDRQAIIGVSEHHLFTKDREENAVMRDLQGELLSSLGPNIDFCFEMPDQKLLITATQRGAKVACWDTSKSQALCIKEHHIQVDPAHDDSWMYEIRRFGDLLVMLCGREREVGTFWTYEMSHPERPPQEVSNLGDKRFYDLHYAVTSNHLFCQSSDGSYNAYTIKEGTLSKQWEINNSTQVSNM